MGLENIVLSEISQTKTNTVWDHLNLESKKIIQTNVHSKIETDTLMKKTSQWLQVRNSGYKWGKEREEGYGIKRNKLLCIK